MPAAMYPVHPEPFTVDDLYALPDDGMRHELVDETSLVSPPPTVGHQRATTRLTLLAAAASRELEVLEGTGVRLSSARVLQPDVIVVSRGALTAEMRDAAPSAVHVAIEVMSPSSVTNDRVTKPTLYAEAGIPVYVRIELAGSDAPVAYVYQLKGKAYRESARVPVGQRFSLEEPVQVSFDPAERLAP